MMELSQDDLRLAFTPIFKQAGLYFQKLAIELRNAIQETTYTYINASIQISYNSSNGFSYTYRLNLSNSEEQDDTQLCNCLDRSIAILGLPPPELPKKFSFELLLDGRLPECNIKLGANSLDIWLVGEAASIAARVNRKALEQKLHFKEHCIFELRFDYALSNGTCARMDNRQPSENDQQICKFIVEAALEHIQNRNREESTPTVLHICFLSKPDGLQHFVPPINVLCNLDFIPAIPSYLKSCPQSTEYRQPYTLDTDPHDLILSLTDPKTELHRARFEKHPNNPQIALQYLDSLWTLQKTPNEFYSNIITPIKQIVAYNPNYADAHERLANSLWQYAKAQNALSDFLAEITKEYHQTIKLDPKKAETVIRTFANSLLSCGRPEEALSEYMSEAFKQYRVPPHILSYTYTSHIASIYKDFGDIESSRQVIREALSILKPETDSWNLFHTLLTKYKSAIE